jgi:hypothetical protein
MQHSTERSVLADGIHALVELCGTDTDGLFVSVVSGFAAVNERSRADASGRKCCFVQQIARQDDELIELRATRVEVQELEIRAIIARAEHAEAHARDNEMQITVIHEMAVRRDTELATALARSGEQVDQIARMPVKWIDIYAQLVNLKKQ